MFGRTTRSLVLCIVGAWATAVSPLQSTQSLAFFGDGYTLEMLTSSQRKQLEERIETFALATSLLNHCGKPPRTVQRARAVAEGCVAPASLQIIADKFAEKLTEASDGANWKCQDPNVKALSRRMEHAIEATIQDIRKACRK